MPLQAGTFFHAGGIERTGMAVEVRRGIVAGVIVRQSEGRATSTATFSGAVQQELLGGDAPFTTTRVDLAHVQVVTVGGSLAEPALYRRTVTLGRDTIELQRATRTVVLEPFGFGGITVLEDWAGRVVLLRTHASGTVDATDLTFQTQVELDGRPALLGTADDGRAGLLVLDPATGVLAGAYEPTPGEPIAFASLGQPAAAEQVEGVWVRIGAGGAWVGGDHVLHVHRLAASPSQGKVAVSSVTPALIDHALRALEGASATSAHVPPRGESR